MNNHLQPLFVVGVARSGTSYLHALLNQHPKIRLSYESRLPSEGFHCYRRYAHLDSQPVFNRLLDELIDLESRENQNDWLIRSIENHRNLLFERHLAHASFFGLVEDIFTADGPIQCFGNKMLRAELCPKISNLWPNARFIVLLRDPRAVVASQIRRFKGRRLQYAAIYCNTHFSWTFRHAVNRKNYLILAYEQLMADPKTQLQNILKFCGIQDTFYHHRMLQKKPVFIGSIDKWRNTLTYAQIQRIESYCYTGMKTAGYRFETPARPKKISAIEKCIELGFEKREALLYSPRKWQQKNIIHRLKDMLHP